MNKPELGQFKKAGVAPQKVLKEFRLQDVAAYEIGKTVTVDTFAAGDKVDVVGTTKGHGFSGVNRDGNQQELKMTHGSRPRSQRSRFYGRKQLAVESI